MIFCSIVMQNIQILYSGHLFLTIFIKLANHNKSNVCHLFNIILLHIYQCAGVKSMTVVETIVSKYGSLVTNNMTV